MKIQNYLNAILQYIYQTRVNEFNYKNYTLLDKDIHHVALPTSYKPQYKYQIDKQLL